MAIKMYIADVYGDDVGATFTTPTTGWHAFPGSTIWTGRSENGNYATPMPRNTSGLGFRIGNQGMGTWYLSWDASFTGNVGNNSYHLAFYKNSSKLGNLSAERKLGTAGDIGSASKSGFVTTLRNNDEITFRVQTQTSGTQVTINHLTLNAIFMSTSTSITVV